MAKFIYDATLTPEEEGGYSVEVPSLPGCFTCGDDYRDATFMVADAMKTRLAATMLHGDEVPPYRKENAPEGCERVAVFVETDENYIVDGPVVSAAEAARKLGVSAGRITHMLDAGVLGGYRNGRRTYITETSIEARMSDTPKAGRPRKKALQA